MKLVVGLGNPGPEYKDNRHNVGHVAVNYFSSSSKLKGYIFKNTDVFMNVSGDFVKNLIHKYKVTPAELFVVHDDLDIRLGEYKIQLGKGPKVHNGLGSIYGELSTKDFWHVRIGVDNRDIENRIKGEDYVLADFTAQEKEIIDKVISDICKKLETL